MTDAERFAAVDFIAANPTAGDVIEGIGDCRKVRIVREDAPVFLLTVISKSRQANLAAAQKDELKKGKRR